MRERKEKEGKRDRGREGERKRGRKRERERGREGEGEREHLRCSFGCKVIRSMNSFPIQSEFEH